MASDLVAMASNLVAMACNLVAMASNLVAMASNLLAMAFNLALAFCAIILSNGTCSRLTAPEVSGIVGWLRGDPIEEEESKASEVQWIGRVFKPQPE